MDLEAQAKKFFSDVKKNPHYYFSRMGLQMANPYNDKLKGACLEECPDPEISGSTSTRDHDATETSEEDSFRVATRARITYELYSFSKNALLIVCSRSDAVIRRNLIDDLRKTFESYRFEVDICEIANSSDLYGKCEQCKLVGVFQRDFTDYGAVALTIVTSMVRTGEQSGNSEDHKISFVKVAENFKLERNPTLATKPKIYITESNRRMFSPVHRDSLVLRQSTHGDVIGFHVPMTLPDLNKSTKERSIRRRYSPLNILCEKMAAMAEDNNFVSIVEETMKESLVRFPLLENDPIDLVNTLSKELYLAKVVENP